MSRGEVDAPYEEMPEDGIARESPRVNLPLSLYTELYRRIDLHDLMHFLRLRMDAHAQYEIRVSAEALAGCAKAVAPLAWEAFEKHRLHAESFARSERAVLREAVDPERLAAALEGSGLRPSRRRELLEKPGVWEVEDFAAT